VTDADQPEAADAPDETPELPLLTLRDGLPPVTDTDIALRKAATRARASS